MLSKLAQHFFLKNYIERRYIIVALMEKFTLNYVPQHVAQHFNYVAQRNSRGIYNIPLLRAVVAVEKRGII